MTRASQFALLWIATTSLAALSLDQGATAQTALDPQLLQAPADGGARRCEVTQDIQVFTAPSTDAEVADTQAVGAVLSNLGCSENDGQFWCTVRPFRGGARGFVQPNYLQPAAGPDGVVAIGKDTSKSRTKKRDFDATGDILCAQERGQTLGKCGAAVARSDGGDATVLVTFPNGFARSLYFKHGEFISASATMSGVGTDTDWRLESDTHFIRVDDQQFEISNAWVFGN